MSILKLKPSCNDYLWGGHRLAEDDMSINVAVTYVQVLAEHGFCEWMSRLDVPWSIQPHSWINFTTQSD